MKSCLAPTLAAIGLVATVGYAPHAAAGTLNFDGTVLPPPAGCSFLPGVIYDPAPKVRPTAVLWERAAVSAAVSLNSVGRRMVGYSYRFGSMDSRVPANFAGTFSPYSSRVSTYEGPWFIGYPRASTQTYLNTATTSAVNFLWSGGAWEVTPYSNDWLVRVDVEGYQQATPGAPLVVRVLSFLCPVKVQPLAPGPITLQ